MWCKPERLDDQAKTVRWEEVEAQPFTKARIVFKPEELRVMQLDFPDEDAQMQRSMEDEELKRWLLLTYARPVHCQYEAQADDKYKPGQKQHEFKTQDTVVRQQAEFPHTSRTGRERDTMIAAVSCVGVNAEHRLEVSKCDDLDSHIFFEKVAVPAHLINPPPAFTTSRWETSTSDRRKRRMWTRLCVLLCVVSMQNWQFYCCCCRPRTRRA